MVNGCIQTFSFFQIEEMICEHERRTPELRRLLMARFGWLQQPAVSKVPAEALGPGCAIGENYKRRRRSGRAVARGFTSLHREPIHQRREGARDGGMEGGELRVDHCHQHRLMAPLLQVNKAVGG